MKFKSNLTEEEIKRIATKSGKTVEEVASDSFIYVI